MAKRVTGPEIEKLIQLLAKVPGLGPRSARRAALHLIKKKDQLLGPLGHAMGEAYDKVKICSCCGNVDTVDPCTVCTDVARDQTVIIVVEDVSDLWALERAGVGAVKYHVLGGLLSALDGVDDLSLTTNATQLSLQAQALRDAGVNRINVSLDSLRDDCVSHHTPAPVARANTRLTTTRPSHPARPWACDAQRLNWRAARCMAPGEAAEEVWSGMAGATIF